MADASITFAAADNSTATLPKSVVNACWLTVARMLEDIGDDDDDDEPVPLQNIDGLTMTQLVEFARRYPTAKPPNTPEQDLEMRTTPISGWDKTFVDMPLADLIKLMNAANYLDHQRLLDLTCKAMAEMIEGKNETEIKAVFGITGDFTPAERERVYADNQWLEPSVPIEVSSDEEPPSPYDSDGEPAAKKTRGGGGAAGSA